MFPWMWFQHINLVYRDWKWFYQIVDNSNNNRAHVIVPHMIVANCVPRTKYVWGILWFSRRYAAASADTSSFSR